MKIEQYADYVRTDIQGIADDILLSEHDRTNDPVEIAFYLHHYVYREVEYDDRHAESRSIRDPLDCLDLGGNCEEQVVLVASLLASKEIPIQFVELLPPNEDYGHLTLRCCITDGAKDVRAEIAELCETTPTVPDYSKVISIRIKSTNERWYYADPTMGTYLGDPSGLKNQGYISKYGFDWLCDLNAYDPTRMEPAQT